MSTATTPATGRGRTAQTKGVSMQPAELADARAIEELTGIGFSELYHRHLAPQLHVAAELLREASDAGMDVTRARLQDGWHLHMSRRELDGLYTESSELILGE